MRRNKAVNSINTYYTKTTTALHIMPPDLLGEGQKLLTKTRSFDTQELSPSKLADGEAVELRFLGNYSTGHMDFVFRCQVQE